MRDNEIQRNECLADQTDNLGNEEEKDSFYTETFKDMYGTYKDTFVSIWDKQHNIIQDSNLNTAQKATATVVNLVNGGISAFSTVTNFTSSISEALVLPLLRTINVARGIGCLPVGKQLDPVLNLMDIHMVLAPPSPSPVPSTHPFMGLSFRAKDFLAIGLLRITVDALAGVKAVSNNAVDNGALSEENAELVIDSASTVTSIGRIFIGNLGASVIIGYVLPRSVAGTGIRCFQHAPAGGGFHPVAEGTIMKNRGHAFTGSMFVVADGSPLVGSICHAQNACSDIGIRSIHDSGPKPDPDSGVKAKRYIPTGMLIPIPFTRMVLTNPIPSPINILQAPVKALSATFKRLKSRRAKKVKLNAENGKPCSNFSKALNKANNKLFKHKYTQGLYNKIDKSIKTYVGHPIDVAGGDLFTDSRDFSFAGIIPLSFERVWYSNSDYNGPLGYGWHHSYDMALFVNTDFRRAQVRLADGRLINFDRIPTRELPTPRYHRSEKLWLCYQQLGGYYYLKDQKDEVFSFNTPLYASRQESYLLSDISNNKGFSIRFTYDANGTLTQIIDSVHRVYTVESDHQRRIAKVWTDAPEAGVPKVCLAEYGYSEEGDLIVHYDEMRQPLKMKYEHHLLLEETWRNGHHWFFKYDGKHTGANCIETWGDGGIQHFKLTYYQGETHAVDGEGNTTIYKHRNQIVYKTIDAKGAVWEKFHNKYGELERSKDPLGNVCNYLHDEWGNVACIIEPDGQFTQFQYLDGDYPYLPTEVIDSRGGKWSYTYSADGRLRERRNPLGAKKSYVYNEKGLLAEVTDGLNRSTVFTYDSNYNVSSRTTSGGNAIHYQYDLWNRRTHCINAHGAQQKRVLDHLGRALIIYDFDGNTIQMKYDALDNVIQYEDHHRKVLFSYKGMHKLIKRSEGGKVVRFRYDSNERLRCISNEEGQHYYFDLDAVGQVIQEKGFDGVEKKYERNECGWVTSIQRPAKRWTNFVYDEMGRVIQVNSSDKTSETYVYEFGAMVQAENETGVVAFKYDIEGQVVEESFNGQKVQSTYDSYGRRTTLSSSLGAHFVYQFDELNNVVESRLNDWKVEQMYDALGLECSRNFEEGLQQVWSYDSLGRLKSQGINKVKGDRVVVPQFYRQYAWAEGSLLCQITDQGQKQTRYQRDQRGNLQRIRYSDGAVEERGVDASGNLYQRLNCKDRMYSKNRLIETDKARYTYDKEGFLIEKEEKESGKKWRYSWNSVGMLTQVLRPDGYSVDFQYDALGRRVSKKYKHTITHYLWQGDVVLHEYKRFDARETTAEDMITWVFEQGSYSPMAKIKGDKKYSLVVDHLGTPIRAYTANGDKVWERELDSCGNARIAVGEEGFCNYLYQGQTYDKEIGLAYNRFRYYDPETGNYISQDPIGLAGNNPTLYGYVADPTGWLDVFGLDLTDQMTFKEAFRRAKQQLRIPKAVNNPKPVYVYDSQYENRTVWAFTGDHSGKFIIMHGEDKFGRGPHLHTADDKKGSPLSPGKYNQHDGHIPENIKGISNIKKHSY
ncbi:MULTISPECIES: DUF6531 domain-containing protein [unclassified Myroides]|uniref:DUF6531 domain-containing protein n=1 Tax=unclassified Myroides TaxID=2642485 RepID=UPI003D2F6D6F